MQIGPAVSQAIGNFREFHGKYRSVISELTETTDRPFPRLAKRREILIFPRTAGNTGNSRELLGNRLLTY